MPRRRRTRAIALVFTVVLGVALVYLLVRVLMSRFGRDDPHGFVMILGVVLGIGLALLLSAVAPLAAPPERESSARSWALAGAAAVAIGLVTLLVTA